MRNQFRSVYLFTFITISSFNSSLLDAKQSLNDRYLYEIWIEVIESTHNSHIDNQVQTYNVIAENFYQIYRETDNPVYLNYALHEAGRSFRTEILNRLSEDESDRYSTLINKVFHQEISEELFQIRDFSPSDIYLFHMMSIPEEMEDSARQLLDHWYITLPDLFNSDPIEATFKAQTLVMGYNKFDEFDRIVEISYDLIKYQILPTSLFTFNLYDLLIYPTYVRGDYSQALRIFEESLLPIVSELNDHEDIARVRMNYASTLLLIGKIDEALIEYESIYFETDSVENYSFYRTLLNNLALTYSLTGNFDGSLEFQLKSYEIANDENLIDLQVDILRNLYHHQVRNDYNLAFDYLNQALDLARENNLTRELPSLLMAKGLYIRDIEDDPIRSLDSFHEALTTVNETGFYSDHKFTLTNLAVTYSKTGNQDLAEKYYLDAIELSSGGNDPVGYLNTSMDYAFWLINNGRYGEAIRIKESFSFRDIAQLPFYYVTQYKAVEINLLMHNGLINEANQIAETSFNEVIDWMLQSSDQQTGHMQIDPVYSEILRLYTLLQQMQGNYSSALAVSGSVRNISRTGFYNNPALKANLLTESELIQDYNLGIRIQQLRTMYVEAGPQQGNQIRTELTNAISERNILINRAFPRHVESQYDELLSNRKKHLNRGEMVIYFTKFENQLFQFFVTRSGVTMKTYPNDPDFYKPIDETIASFGYRSTNLEQLYELYKTYFEGNIPEGIDHVYIVPDGDLYRIPFEILPTEPVESPHSYGSARYFIEDYSVSYLNTLGDLTKKQNGSNGHFETDIAAFGISNFSEAGHQQLADLPFSPIEVVNTVNNLNSLDRSQMFIEKNSSESNFKNIAGHARIIHLATHSRVLDNNPLFSSFYLYSGIDDPSTVSDPESRLNDGIVRAYEIFDLNLNADLIFLSSCESGSGGYLQGAGILGFSRAFSYAGAKSLILNLWPVRDQASAELTPNFYDYLNSGLNKAKSIQETKIRYMNQRDSDPYLWGSFVIYGNIEPMIDNRSTLFNVIIASLSILGILFLITYIRRLVKL